MTNAGTSFDGLLPQGVVVVEATSVLWWEQGLLQGEQGHVARATDKRRREFTAGRNCARAALSRLGLPVGAIGVGPQREPLFPSGASGSITHTTGYCAAAVVRQAEVRAIGIDAECDAPMEEGVARLIMDPVERGALWTHAHLGNVDVLAFSLKEAFYKAAYPFCQRRLAFKDVAIRLTDRGSEIDVQCPWLAAELAGLSIHANYRFSSRRIHGAVTLTER